MLQLSSRLVLAYADDCFLELIMSHEYVAYSLELCHCLLHSVWLPVHLTCPVISLLCTAHTTDIAPRCESCGSRSTTARVLLA